MCQKLRQPKRWPLFSLSNIFDHVFSGHVCLSACLPVCSRWLHSRPTTSQQRDAFKKKTRQRNCPNPLLPPYQLVNTQIGNIGKFFYPPTYECNSEIGTKLQGSEKNIFFLWARPKNYLLQLEDINISREVHDQHRSFIGQSLLSKVFAKLSDELIREDLKKISLSGGKNFMFEITSLFSYKKNTICNNFYREFFARPTYQ